MSRGDYVQYVCRYVPHNFPFRKDGMGINMENGNILCYVGSFVLHAMLIVTQMFLNLFQLRTIFTLKLHHTFTCT